MTVPAGTYQGHAARSAQWASRTAEYVRKACAVPYWLAAACVTLTSKGAGALERRTQEATCSRVVPAGRSRIWTLYPGYQPPLCRGVREDRGRAGVLGEVADGVGHGPRGSGDGEGGKGLAFPFAHARDPAIGQEQLRGGGRPRSMKRVVESSESRALVTEEGRGNGRQGPGRRSPSDGPCCLGPHARTTAPPNPRRTRRCHRRSGQGPSQGPYQPLRHHAPWLSQGSQGPGVQGTQGGKGSGGNRRRGWKPDGRRRRGGAGRLRRGPN